MHLHEFVPKHVAEEGLTFACADYVFSQPLPHYNSRTASVIWLSLTDLRHPLRASIEESQLHKMSAEELAAIFQQTFNIPPKIFRAPGRVNLIGEHTDYNDGFVLPSAIGFYTQVVVSPRADRKMFLRSTEFSESFEIDLNKPQEKQDAWCDYVVGVALELLRAGVRVNGANLLVHGEVPVGAGLSSSAALEVASVLALLSLGDTTMPMKAVAQLCQRAENNFVGARVGIMDQFVSCLGQEDHAVLLDCRSLDFELVPIPETVKLVICNTMVKHQNDSGEYNMRREQCEQGVRLLSKFYPGIRALRDVSVEQLSIQREAIPEITYKRCLHVVQENERVIETGHRFRAGDLAGVGRLMLDSHASLRDLYQVSSKELDLMVEVAEGLPGYVGGRMTGGGFGGCTVNLVETGKAELFASAIADRYRNKTGISPSIHICSAANGAGAELNRASV